MVRQAARALTFVLVAIALLHAGCIRKEEVRPDVPKPVVPPPKPGTPPSGVIACWNKNVEYGTDPISNTTIAGIAGRVYLFDETGTYPLAGDGQMSVELWDDSERAQGGASKKLEIWNLDSETLKKLVKKDFMGTGYSLALPWSTYRKDITQIHMAVHYEPKSGGAMTWTGSPMSVEHGQAPQITHTMPGVPSPVAAMSATK